jgi:hypothetical protein
MPRTRRSRARNCRCQKRKTRKIRKVRMTPFEKRRNVHACTTPQQQHTQSAPRHPLPSSYPSSIYPSPSPQCLSSPSCPACRMGSCSRSPWTPARPTSRTWSSTAPRRSRYSKLSLARVPPRCP